MLCSVKVVERFYYLLLYKDMVFGCLRLFLFVVLVCGIVILLFYVVKRIILNGGYIFWLDWSVCLSDCGDGICFRIRDCVNFVFGRFG